MYRTFIAVTAALLFTSAMPALAAGMNAPMGAQPSAMAASTNYRFVLAGPPASAGSGKSIVSIKLMHGGKPVIGAIIIQSRADMGPIGMPGMTAPIAALGEQPPGTYRFEVQNGAVWKKSANWAFSFAAKIQAEAETVTGNVIVNLTP